MGVEKRIKERMSDAVVRSYYKPWHKRWWGRLIIIFAIISILSVLYLGFKVAVYWTHVKAGEVFNDELEVWISQEQFVENQKLVADLITSDDPWLGSDKPAINIVVYESFGCPFCKGNQPDIRQMLAKFGSLVRFTVKDFPTEALHPGVFEAHLAADCADQQGRYWEYHDELFNNQEAGFARNNLQAIAKKLGLNSKEFDQCLINENFSQEIRQDYASGVNLGVVGTPTYIINGIVIPGAISMDMWEQIIGYIIKGELQQ